VAPQQEWIQPAKTRQRQQRGRSSGAKLRRDLKTSKHLQKKVGRYSRHVAFFFFSSFFFFLRPLGPKPKPKGPRAPYSLRPGAEGPEGRSRSRDWRPQGAEFFDLESPRASNGGLRGSRMTKGVEGRQ
jgi:hypothetical protein